MTAPRKSILDPTFRYTDAANTSLKRTFARIRKAQAEQKRREREQQSADTDKVLRNFEERRKAGK